LDLDESDGRNPAPVKRIAAQNGVSEESVRKYRKLFAEGGLKNLLKRKKRETPPVAAKVTGLMKSVGC